MIQGTSDNEEKEEGKEKEKEEVKKNSLNNQ